MHVQIMLRKGWLLDPKIMRHHPPPTVKSLSACTESAPKMRPPTHHPENRVNSENSNHPTQGKGCNPETMVPKKAAIHRSARRSSAAHRSIILPSRGQQTRDCLSIKGDRH
jgi:hypothetical protein